MQLPLLYLQTASVKVSKLLIYGRQYSKEDVKSVLHTLLLDELTLQAIMRALPW